MSRSCFQNHMGSWAMHVPWFDAAFSAIRAGLWKPSAKAPSVQLVRGISVTGEVLDPQPDPWVVRSVGKRADVVVLSEEPAGDGTVAYRVTDSRVAIMDVEGPLQKEASKWGGTSYRGLEAALGKAVGDSKVDAILLRIDSPGGHVSGCHEAAAAIAAANKQKPVHAFGEDLMASAAYWLASRAARVTCNAAAEVGSIGVFAFLVDDSKRAEMMGIRTVLIATGPHKGVGAPGQALTEEQLGPIREGVEAVAALFFADVQKGRRLTDARLEAVTTGRVWPSAMALELRLVDEVTTFEAAVSAAAKAGGSSGSARGGRRGADLVDRELALRGFMLEPPAK